MLCAASRRLSGAGGMVNSCWYQHDLNYAVACFKDQRWLGDKHSVE